jgi:hypothetical protein
VLTDRFGHSLHVLCEAAEQRWLRERVSFGILFEFDCEIDKGKTRGRDCVRAVRRSSQKRRLHWYQDRACK